MIPNNQGVLGESLFRGREILAHNPGYDETSGAGLVLVRAPFFRDRSLFINPEAMLAADPTTTLGGPAEEYTTPTASNPPSEQSHPGEQSPRAQPHAKAAPPDVHFPPTPPNTPKATRSTSEPSLSGPSTTGKFRKLAITWRDDEEPKAPATGPPLSPSTQERMGSHIKSELTPILAHGDPLETLECFPGIALATFSSHELARRAIKVLRQSERLNARPVVDNVPEVTEKGKKRGGKKGGAVSGRTVSAPVVTTDAGTTSPPITSAKETTPTTTAAAAAAPARKTPAVLIVNGSWKI